MLVSYDQQEHIGILTLSRLEARNAWGDDFNEGIERYCAVEELFACQPEAYRRSVLPPEALYDLMVVSTGTRRVWPIKDVGPLTDAYSLTSDWDNQWLTGGLESDVIAEAHLDAESIYTGIKCFAAERTQRLERQRTMLTALG